MEYGRMDVCTAIPGSNGKQCGVGPTTRRIIAGADLEGEEEGNQDLSTWSKWDYVPYRTVNVTILETTAAGIYSHAKHMEYMIDDSVCEDD
uniref:Uncharacterized protein n=1 Tax=Oryza nivara TaxID=4536 RepID=A0A0E0FWG6_ORYNI